MSELMKESSSIVIMDNFIGQTDIDFLTDFVKTRMPDNDWEVEVHVSGYQQHIGHKVTIYDNVTASKRDRAKLVN